MSRRPHFRIFALLCLLQLSACYRYRLEPVRLPPLTDPVTLAYGNDTMTVRHPSLEGDSVLLGWRVGEGAEVLVVTPTGARMEPRDSIYVRLPLTIRHRTIRPVASALSALGGLAAFGLVLWAASFHPPTAA